MQTPPLGAPSDIEERQQGGASRSTGDYLPLLGLGGIGLVHGE